MFGYNSRLDNVQAAVLRVKLTYYDADVARRRRFAGIYQERLDDNAALDLPPAPDSDSRHIDVFQNYGIEMDSGEELREFLVPIGISTILQQGGYTVHQIEPLELNGNLPETGAMTKRFMLLPFHQMLSDDDVNNVCDQVTAYYR